MIEGLAGAPEAQTRAGIQTDAIQLRDRRPKGTIPARIDVVAPLGPATVLTVEVGEQEIKAHVPADHRVKSAEEVPLRLTPETIRLHHPETCLGWNLP